MSYKVKRQTNDEVAYQVYRTYDYDKFKYVDGNRDIKSTAKVKKSIKEHGYYRQPILVNEFLEIIEGQHRFLACKELGLPIEYVIQSGLRAKDCAPLNTGRTNWRTKNYVHLHSVSTVDYMYFETMIEQFQFSPRVTYVAIGKSLAGGYADKVIQSGNLICTPEEYEYGSRTLRWLSTFKEDVRKHDLRGNKDALYMALIFARNSKFVSVEALTDRIHKNFSKYGRSIADITDAIEKTNDIYNYRCKTENTVDLVSEYRLAMRKEKIHESKAESK